jgi:ABC-type uncharacterized transport system permease subunit
MSRALLVATVLLYAISSLMFIAQLLGRRSTLLALARRTLALALLVHLALIGSLCVQKLNPLRDLRGALSFSALLLGVGLFLGSRATRMSALGAFIAPLAVALLVSSGITPHDLPAYGAHETTRTLGELHIALSAFGVAAFGLAAAVSFVYLLQERSLKGKRTGLFYRRSPPLATLDDAGKKLILLGFPIFTLAVATGIVFFSRLHEHGGLRPEHVLSGSTWLVFALVILLRYTTGLQGKRAALLTLVGFCAMSGILLIYLTRRLFG